MSIYKKSKKFKIALVCNIKSITSDNTDIEAEYDSIDTVTKLHDTIESLGYLCVIINQSKNIIKDLLKANPNLVFNISEGMGQEYRESEIPSILNMLHIPYTGSNVLTLALALDKDKTKEYLSNFGIKSPKSVTINSIEELNNVQNLISDLTFPLILKPLNEGSSKGIDENSVVEDVNTLLKALELKIVQYNEKIMLEEYVVGREFTVGLIVNNIEVEAFSPMEIEYKDNYFNKYKVYDYKVKQNGNKYVNFNCPANISSDLEVNMKKNAIKIFNILECKDFSRVDFIVDEKDNIYFIEINPLPGLSYGFSDFPNIAASCQTSYSRLIDMIINSAKQRYNL